MVENANDPELSHPGNTVSTAMRHGMRQRWPGQSFLAGWWRNGGHYFLEAETQRIADVAAIWRNSTKTARRVECNRFNLSCACFKPKFFVTKP
jgi:hypothetical protein